MASVRYMIVPKPIPVVVKMLIDQKLLAYADGESNIVVARFGVNKTELKKIIKKGGL